MADFCRKCAGELGQDPDLTIENLKIGENQFGRFLCEGCGWLYIENVDGKEVVYRKET